MFHDKFGLRYIPLTLDGDVGLLEWRHLWLFRSPSKKNLSSLIGWKAEPQEVCNSAHAVHQCNVYTVCDMKQ